LFVNSLEGPDVFVISATSTCNTSTDSSNQNLAATLQLLGPTRRTRVPVLVEENEPEVVTHEDDTVLQENDVGIKPDDSPPVVA